MKKHFRHKWRKGGLPQLCLNCGILRDRQTFKILMAVVNHPPWNLFKYETRMVYTNIEKTFHKAPSCINPKILKDERKRIESKAVKAS